MKINFLFPLHLDYLSSYVFYVYPASCLIANFELASEELYYAHVQSCKFWVDTEKSPSFNLLEAIGFFF